jgi:hypothetical protein
MSRLQGQCNSRCERELFRNRAVEHSDPHIPGADSISIGFTCLGMREGTLLP